MSHELKSKLRTRVSWSRYRVRRECKIWEEIQLFPDPAGPMMVSTWEFESSNHDLYDAWLWSQVIELGCAGAGFNHPKEASGCERAYWKT